MPRPQNGIYIIQGEVSLVVTAMRRTSRWTSHNHQDDDQDPLISNFSRLKDILNNISGLDDIAPNEFLSPFLEVIRSEDTTGPITGLALTSVNKFLSYGLIDPSCETAAAAIENIADAVTHARFVGTDPGSDEVVLMKILHVLRTLLLIAAGALLTNESVCEIMQSCFRICFEMRLSELLRRSAEHTLMDMVQLLFSRIPQFREDTKWAINMKKLKMRAGGIDSARSGKKKKNSKTRHKKVSQQQQQQQGNAMTTTVPSHPSPAQPNTAESTEPSTTQPPTPTTAPDQPPATEATHTDGDKPRPPPEGDPMTMSMEGAEGDPAQMMAEAEEMLERPETIATTPVAPTHLRTMVDIHDSFRDASDREDGEKGTEEGGQVCDGQTNEDTESTTDSAYLSVSRETLRTATSETELNVDADKCSFTSETTEDQESTHCQPDQGAPQEEYVNPRGVRFTSQQQHKEGSGPLIPYGLPCVRELFRFLISLTNPLDRHNTDVMVHMGLSLLTVALEAGADHISSFNSLLILVKDDMCRNLFFLLQSERLSLYAASLRVCFLLFESMRSHLKFQLEMYLIKLMDITVSESPRISYEQREIALESVVQLIRIPGLVTELYLNYDCDLYCTNLFDDLMKLLSKNAFPVSGLFSTHLLSLDALLAVIDSIEQQCHHRILTKVASSDNRTDEDKQADGLRTDDMSSSTENINNVQQTAAPPVATDNTNNEAEANEVLAKDSPNVPNLRQNRMQISANIPTVEELAMTKHKKRVYQTGTEYFNTKPSKGISYLQEQGLLCSPLDATEVVRFLKENPKLDKKQIGEYVSKKGNVKVLEAFQRSFSYENTRVDESLRMFLETFRLPGEAPVISYILEHFAEHWHKSNGEPFANADAAFTLAYAVIMLNVDQHNHNAKKQNIPMTVQEFKKNVKGVNGGKDFDEDMLEEVFQAIRNEEIVMPAEQTGLVRENYLWKILLRRGQGKEGLFTHAPTGTFDHDLFALVWGPTVAALSFVFDKSIDEVIIQKAISGFRKCAMISAHYGMSDVFDNLVISLCKFTTLLSTAESAENIPIVFGNNLKAQLATRTVFGLAHRHGDILREGWKNMLDCMLQLFRAKLLPELLVKVEDFVDPDGRISLVKEELTSSQRSETGVLSSFYSYFSLSETPQQRGPSLEEQEATKQAHRCIQDCHLEQLITESKFLRMESLHELIKALVFASRCPEQHLHDGMGNAACDEDASVFYLELLIRVVLQNRDRVGPFWQTVRDHIYNLIVNATEHTFLVERAVVGLLRLAIRLLRREEVASQVLTSLQIVLMMKSGVIHSVCRQLSFGLHDLLRTNAANIHSSQDWFTLFTLLEVVGAGANPPPLMQVGAGVDVQESISDTGAQSDSEISSGIHSEGGDRGYTSDSEIYSNTQDRHHRPSVELEVQPMQRNGSWLLVNKQQKDESENGIKKSAMVNQYNIVLNEELQYSDNKALMKSCETLAFLVRDAAHVTPHNFESCVHAIRTFVEASLHGGRQAPQKQASPVHSKENRRGSHKSKRKDSKMKKSKSSPSHLHQAAHHSDEEAENDGYHSMSIQLLDLMHTLHTRAATIFSSWAEEECTHSGGIDAGAGALWLKCWCPLLQGIARLCCDTRRQVRSQALTYLQRALLVHDLQTLSAVEWESCFNKVLFPLLSKLLDPISAHDPSGVEETRMRASTLLCKVFLQHLSPLLSLPTFTALWLTILDFMDKYMHADKSDLLCEAIPESLKNMLLVMHTAGILQSSEADASQLWRLTWHRIETFLPELKNEVFKPHEIADKRAAVDTAAPTEQVAMSSQNGQTDSVSPAAPGVSSPCQSDGEGELPPPYAEPSVQTTQVAPQITAPAPVPAPAPLPASVLPGSVPVAPLPGVTGVTLPPPPPPLPIGTPVPPAAATTTTSNTAEPRAESPLSAGFTAAAPGTYILHPPLPNLNPTKDAPPLPVPVPLPILLNPSLMPQVTMPVITTQQQPSEKKAEVTTEGH